MYNNTVQADITDLDVRFQHYNPDNYCDLNYYCSRFNLAVCSFFINVVLEHFNTQATVLPHQCVNMAHRLTKLDKHGPTGSID